MSIFARSDPERDTAVMLGDPRKAILVTVIPFFISIVAGQINMLADLAWCSALGSESGHCQWSWFITLGIWMPAAFAASL